MFYDHFPSQSNEYSDEQSGLVQNQPRVRRQSSILRALLPPSEQNYTVLQQNYCRTGHFHYAAFSFVLRQAQLKGNPIQEQGIVYFLLVAFQTPVSPFADF